MDSPVVGLDVSRDTADIFVSFAALTVPPRDFYELPEFDGYHYQKPIDAEMADFLAALNPKVVVLEPTGPYSKFEITALEERGIPFLLVNQTMVRDTRKSFGGSDNKDDPFDSLLMTVIYYEKWERVLDRRFWVQYRHPTIRRIRTLLLDIRSAVKKSGAARSSIKQRLVRGEWIAKAKVSSDRQNGSLHPDKLPAFYAWLVSVALPGRVGDSQTLPHPLGERVSRSLRARGSSTHQPHRRVTGSHHLPPPPDRSPAGA
jgi:hypothetical protein